MSRWIELYRTSPSGKTMFVCRMCGTISPVPTRRCAERPEVYQRASLECEMLEEIEGALNDENVDKQAVREGKLVLVAEKGTDVDGERARYTVQWCTFESQWNSTDIYMNKDLATK